MWTVACLLVFFIVHLEVDRSGSRSLSSYSETIRLSFSSSRGDEMQSQVQFEPRPMKRVWSKTSSLATTRWSVQLPTSVTRWWLRWACSSSSWLTWWGPAPPSSVFSTVSCLSSFVCLCRMRLTRLSAATWDSNRSDAVVVFPLMLWNINAETYVVL